MDSSFQLDPEEHKRVYSEIIEPTYFLDTDSVDRPSLIVIAAQPGAGKSNIVRLSVQEFGNSNVVIVNTDDLRAYHPRFDEIVSSDDTRSAERTHNDASGWKDMLLKRCIETGRNVILEGVFKDAKYLLSVCEQARKNGYTVTIRVVAVHERFSVWGVYHRYEVEKSSRGHGRYVPISYHNDCYEKLLNSIENVESQGSADGIEVYSRDGARLYSSNDSGGNAVQAIKNERDRSLTKPEIRQYRDSWSRVFDNMSRRSASKDEIGPVKTIASDFISKLQS